MRIGLRIQILFVIGLLLVVALGPLLLAQGALARLSLDRQQHELALALGRVACDAELSGTTPDGQSSHRLLAGYVSRVSSTGPLTFGNDGWQTQLQRPLTDTLRGVVVTRGSQRALLVSHEDARGQARVLVLLDDTTMSLRHLIRSYGLYMGLVALLLLVIIYIALGRLVLQPLEILAHAAERVASGSRRWEVSSMPAREFSMLAQSLSTMTARLLDEEHQLRRRIDEVHAATERLREAQASLVRSERLASVGRLAAGLAHEIGNPLASLMGFEDLLISGGLSAAEQSDFLARMRRETERIHKVLRDLLDFARPTQGRLASAPQEPGDVSAATDDALALLSPQKIMREVQVLRQLDNALPQVTLGRSELVQVLLNLMLNAADALNGHGVIQVAASRLSQRVRIEVTDDGPGISEAVREHLFEPFVTSKEVGKGTGLGLAVCRGLVESAGGSIGWDASFTGGARFVVELPQYGASEKANQ